jgi:hypothetical protein
LQEPEKVQGKKNFSIAGKPLFSEITRRHAINLMNLKKTKKPIFSLVTPPIAKIATIRPITSLPLSRKKNAAHCQAHRGQGGLSEFVQ